MNVIEEYCMRKVLFFTLAASCLLQSTTDAVQANNSAKSTEAGTAKDKMSKSEKVLYDYNKERYYDLMDLLDYIEEKNTKECIKIIDGLKKDPHTFYLAFTTVSDGLTALAWAINFNLTEVAVHIVNTVMELWRKSPKYALDIINALVKYSGNVLHFAVFHSRYEPAIAILKAARELNAVPEVLAFKDLYTKDRNVFHKCISRKNEFTKLVYTYLKDIYSTNSFTVMNIINAKDCEGNTPLVLLMRFLNEEELSNFLNFLKTLSATDQREILNTFVRCNDNMFPRAKEMTALLDSYFVKVMGYHVPSQSVPTSSSGAGRTVELNIEDFQEKTDSKADKADPASSKNDSASLEKGTIPQQMSGNSQDTHETSDAASQQTIAAPQNVHENTDAGVIAGQIHSFEDYIRVLGQYWRGGGHHGQPLPVSGEKASISASKIVRAIIDYVTALSQGKTPARTRTLERIVDTIARAAPDVLTQDLVRVAVIIIENLFRTQMDTLPQQSRAEASRALQLLENFVSSTYPNDTLRQSGPRVSETNGHKEEAAAVASGPTATEKSGDSSTKERASQIDTIPTVQEPTYTVKIMPTKDGIKYVYPSNYPTSKTSESSKIKTVIQSASVAETAKTKIKMSEVKFNKIRADRIIVAGIEVELYKPTQNITLRKGDKVKRKHIVAVVKSGDIAKLDWIITNCKFEDKKLFVFNESGRIWDCIEMKYPHNHLLHIAVEKDDINMLNYLLSKGANINIINDVGDTALHTAAEVGNKSIVQLLLQNGADVNFTNKSLETPLHLAATKKDAQIAQLLVDNGANVNAKNKSDFTALQLACFYGNKETMQVLTAHGADRSTLKLRSMATKQLEAALRMAAGHNNIDVAESLIDADVDLNASRAIFDAIENKDLQMVNLLIRNKADVNITGEYDDRTPLHSAAEVGNVQIAQALIKAGAKIDARNKEEQTPLHLAVLNDENIEVVRLLLQNHADINARADSDCTPLHYAAWKNSKEIARWLIRFGANKNAKQYKGLTPLDRVVKDKEIWRKILM